MIGTIRPCRYKKSLKKAYFMRKNINNSVIKKYIFQNTYFFLNTYFFYQIRHN